MDAAGFIIGVPGLLTACLDLLERVDAYKDFDVESRNNMALLEAQRARLKLWGDKMGIRNGDLLGCHDPRLDSPDISLVIRRLLDNAIELFEATETTGSRFRQHTGEDSNAINEFEDPKVKRPLKRTGSIPVKHRLQWALRSRGRFTNQVNSLSKIVDALYSLVPLDQPVTVSSAKPVNERMLPAKGRLR
jgi:hypothetical protein